MTFNSKIFRTSTFRLAAIYLIFFAFSVCAVLAYVYWNTVGILERQTDETIRAEVQGLSDQYRLLNLAGVADVIKRRIDEGAGSIYLLADDDNEQVIGNIDKMPPTAVGEPGWVDFPIVVGKAPKQQKHTGRAYHAPLPGGYRLLVGRDVEEQRLFGDTIRQAVTWALGLALVLGLGGGWVLSRNFLRRVDAITDTSRTIMAGDLTQRMPVSGSDDELDRLAKSLNDMLSQIERLMAGMKEVSGNVAHDLRTPLTRMRARIELALRSENDATHKQALEKTLEDSDRLLSTFNALLSIARAEAGHSREGFAETDAAEIVHEVAELYEPIVEDEGGTLTLNVDANIPVKADRQLLAQALSNLLDNALKYGGKEEGEATTVTVTARAVDGKAVITVADQGHGIAVADRTRVLDRFVRLDESRNKPGNGLGLSLVSSVMKLHGGSLTLGDAEPGLLATLELPLLAEQKAA
ncbi:sensor histidine kinase [Aestuariivirga sp.]|uniref:sensor histidine kinase n=1 Tax=Aestuariivirga sp. TaxID=2650926 RepID=UPI0039E385BA